MPTRVDLPILVVAAVPQELSCFRRHANEEVHCLLTGVGQERAFRAVRNVLNRRRYRLVISAGFAGGTQPGLQVGDLVMASEVVEASSGQRWRPGIPLDSSITVGTLLTTRHPLVDPQAKAKAGLRYGAVAVDMETAAVARVASEAQVPWVSLRAILDPMEVRLSLVSWVQGLWCLAFPSRWGEFAGFLRAMRLASQSLANGLVTVPGTSLYLVPITRRETDGFGQV